MGLDSMSGEVIIGLAGGALLVCAFIGIGGALLGRRAVGSAPAATLARVPIAAALGFSAYSYASYPIVALGSPSALLVIAFALAGILVGRRFWLDVLREIRPWLRELSLSLRSPIALGFAAMSAGLGVLAAVNWLTPPKEGDALQGYMFTARWLNRHGFAYSPYNPRYSLMPIQTEILYSLSFALGTDLVAKVMDGLLGVLFLLGIYELARRYASPLFSVFAAASMASMTAFVTNWANGKVDITCAFVLFSAFSLLFRKPEGASKRDFWLASFLAGTACAEKYTSWILVPAFLLAVGVLARGRGERRVAAKVLAAGAVVFLCLIPHLARDIALTGDPVAPFAKSLFPTRNVYLGHASDAITTRASDIARMPYLLFFDGDDARKPGPIPLLILVGVPAFVLLAPRRREVKWILIVTSFQLAFWIAVRRGDWLVPRFLLAPLGLLLVVSAVGAERLARDSRGIRWAIAALIAFDLFTLGLWDNRHFRENWPFVAGRETREQWQARMVPHRGYPALHALAPALDASHRLMIGNAVYNLPEDKLPFSSTERELFEFRSLPEDRQGDYLRRNHFAYVYYAGDDRPEWARGARVLSRVKNWYVLYAIGGEPSGSAASENGSGAVGLEPHAAPRALDP